MNTYIIDQHNSVLSWEEEFENSTNHKDVHVDGGKIFTELGKIVGGFAELDFTTFLPKEKKVEDGEEFNMTKFLKNDDIIQGKNLEDAEYKIEKISIRPGHHEQPSREEIQGIMKLNNRAFSFSFPADIDINEKSIKVHGEFHMSDVNPEWNSELQKSNKNNMKDVKLKFDLIANSQQV